MVKDERRRSEPRDLALAPPFAACTITAKNHLPRARVLANSFLRHHPDVPFFVLLVDSIDNCFDPAEEKFKILQIDDLLVPEPDRLCFQYTLFELSCALKPYLFHHLFSRFGFRKLIYFDSDILVLREHSPVFKLLDNHSIILTPHLSSPLDEDGYGPSELNILQAGTYNGGFIAMALTRTTEKFLSWWKTRLRNQCLLDVERGLHHDQKWLDLVPGSFDGVYILRDPGFNIAYWNLPTRHLEIKHGDVNVNGQPAYFFHFSGFNPDNPLTISSYSDRFDIHNVGPAAHLYEKYVELVTGQGHDEAKKWNYGYGSFDNGLKIPDAARRLYLRLGEEVPRFGNPFKTTLPNCFFNWLTGSVDNHPDPAHAVTRLWHEIYSSRPDLQRTFPDILGHDRDAFLQWTVERGLREYGIPDRFGPPASATPRVKTVNRKKRKGTKSRIRLGVNVVGPVASEKGVGEATRSAIRILDAAHIPYTLDDFKDPGSANIDMSFAKVGRKNQQRITLSITGLDAVPGLIEQKGTRFFNNCYTIGHWAWELADFPRDRVSYFQHYDEIWAASSFIQGALARVSPVPVITVPYSVTGEIPDHTQHDMQFGLPADTFIFLFMFDFHSFMERKNPIGLIKAFKKAFSAADNVLLLLKCSHSSEMRRELESIQEASRGANVRIYDCILNRDQVKTLIYLSDCYVSLHRAEGFGLTLAEAMSMEKPVVATGYSGNMDFMNANNSYPVRYRLIPIDQDHGPYERGFVWADPDLDHAAEMMRFVYDNREVAIRVGRQARQDVLATLHPEVVGEQVRERLLKVARS